MALYTENQGRCIGAGCPYLLGTFPYRIASPQAYPPSAPERQLEHYVIELLRFLFGNNPRAGGCHSSSNKVHRNEQRPVPSAPPPDYSAHGRASPRGISRTFERRGGIRIPETQGR